MTGRESILLAGASVLVIAVALTVDPYAVAAEPYRSMQGAARLVIVAAMQDN